MDKVEKFINKELDKVKNKNVLIIKNEDGTYDLFGKYKIVVNSEGHYRVRLTDLTEREATFSSLKNAVTYCVFDQNNKHTCVKRIEELDMLMSSLEVSMGILKKRLNKAQSLNDKFIYLAKLHEGKLKRESIQKEINSYVETSKYWQSKKFEESRSR